MEGSQAKFTYVDLDFSPKLQKKHFRSLMVKKIIFAFSASFPVHLKSWIVYKGNVEYAEYEIYMSSIVTFMIV